MCNQRGQNISGKMYKKQLTAGKDSCVHLLFSVLTKTMFNVCGSTTISKRRT